MSGDCAGLSPDRGEAVKKQLSLDFLVAAGCTVVVEVVEVAWASRFVVAGQKAFRDG